MPNIEQYISGRMKIGKPAQVSWSPSDYKVSECCVGWLSLASSLHSLEAYSSSFSPLAVVLFLCVASPRHARHPTRRRKPFSRPNRTSTTRPASIATNSG